MDDKTAIERTQELLDERGVKHVGNGGITEWANESGCVCRAYSRPGHLTVDVAIMDASPEQAVAATLGDVDATGERRGDAVEVVRCRDCACFSVDDSDHDYRTGWLCKRWYTDMVMPDGFCAWGKRREDK